MKAMNRFLATGERRKTGSVSSKPAADKSEPITANEIIDHVKKHAENVSKEQHSGFTTSLEPKIGLFFYKRLKPF